MLVMVKRDADDVECITIIINRNTHNYCMSRLRTKQVHISEPMTDLSRSLSIFHENNNSTSKQSSINWLLIKNNIPRLVVRKKKKRILIEQKQCLCLYRLE